MPVAHAARCAAFPPVRHEPFPIPVCLLPVLPWPAVLTLSTAGFGSAVLISSPVHAERNHLCVIICYLCVNPYEFTTVTGVYPTEVQCTILLNLYFYGLGIFRGRSMGAGEVGGEECVYHQMSLYPNACIYICIKISLSLSLSHTHIFTGHLATKNRHTQKHNNSATCRNC